MEKGEIQSIYDNIKISCIKISDLISHMNPFTTSKIISKNSSNDNVKRLDLLSNNIMIDELSKNNNIKKLISEENSEIIDINTKGKYLIAFDPIDGSSNIDSNITIGTIFCIYKIDNEELDQIILGKSVVASGYCLYGGSTQLILADKENGVNLYIMEQNKYIDTIKQNCLNNSLINKFKWISKLNIPEKGKIYAINESNKHRWVNKNYLKLLDLFIDIKYTQRWVGSLVADGHRTLIKGGFFSYPCDSKSPDGAIRLLYEAFPFCFIIEMAGGKAYLNDNLSDWRYTKFPKNIHQKTPIIFMSNYENTIINKINKINK